MSVVPLDAQVDFLDRLLKTMVCGIVEREHDVRIQCNATSARVAFTICVHYSDVGLVIGEGGKTVDAIRRIVWTAAKKTGRRVDIDVM